VGQTVSSIGGPVNSLEIYTEAGGKTYPDPKEGTSIQGKQPQERVFRTGRAKGAKDPSLLVRAALVEEIYPLKTRGWGEPYKGGGEPFKRIPARQNVKEKSPSTTISRREPGGLLDRGHLLYGVPSRPDHLPIIEMRPNGQCSQGRRGKHKGRSTLVLFDTYSMRGVKKGQARKERGLDNRVKLRGDELRKSSTIPLVYDSPSSNHNQFGNQEGVPNCDNRGASTTTRNSCI